MEATVPAAALPEHRQPVVKEQDMAQIIPAKMRADLVVRRQTFRHEEYYVLKDPLALTYFRLQPEEAYIISLLDGKRTLGEIARRVTEKYPNNPRTANELAVYVNQLGASRLLNISASRFVESMRGSVTQNLLMIWAKVISGVLFFKIPLVDPSPWLGDLAHAMRFVWTKWFVGAALVLFAWTFGLLVVNSQEFSGQALDFFSASNLMYLWLTMIVIKTLHEFGHATTCRHFGGEVHEMGVCFMCFTPCGYVDASDAWMMRHKRHKMFVTIAGVFTELIIACVAAHLWLFLPDGLPRGLAFNAMMVASVNTIVFNANPLMRFDGYYLVCDLLEIPNLRNKAIAYCSFHLQRIFLGYRNRQQEAAFAHEARGRVFVVYAVLAYLYMIVIIYGLTQIFGRVLQPIGLHDFGLFIGFFVEASFIMFPFIKVAMDAINPGAHITKTGSTRRRLSLLVGGIGLLVAASFYTPTHFRVAQQAVVIAATGELAASDVGGVVRRVHVHTGQWVEPGTRLATLENPEVQLEFEQQSMNLRMARLRGNAAAARGDWASLEGGANEAQNLEVATSSYERARKRLEQLELKATTAGFVITPDLERLVGSFASPARPVLRVADTRRLRLVIPLTEDQAQLVEAGGRIRGRWQATGEKFETTLDVVASQPAKRTEFQAGMMSLWGGPAPFQAVQSDGRDGVHFPVFLATAGLPNAANIQVEGLRAQVTIEGRPTTVARRFGRWFLALFKVQSTRP